MGGDYPDYTSLMQVIGSDIMVPIDLQASYIMMPIDMQAAYIQMPVDIQSQYITLDINIETSEATLDVDIVAQTVGNIAIDIAAQSAGNLTVDISAQTVGDITINFNAQSIGMYVIRDWEAKVDNDKSVTGYTLIEGYQDGTLVDYTVPTGKAFYVDDLSVSGALKGHAWLTIGGTELFHMTFLAYGPIIIIYTTPKKATAGEHIKIEAHNSESGDSYFYGNIGGREITV